MRWKGHAGLNGSEAKGNRASRRDTNTAAPEGTRLGRGVCQALRAVQRPALGSQLPGGEIWADPHFSIAVRTSVGGGVGGVWCRLLRLAWLGGKELPREGESGRAMRVGQISKLPDADETSRQNVLGETAEELACRKGHLPLLVAMRVVLPAEGHALAIEGQQAMIADRNAMRIPPQIAKHLEGPPNACFAYTTQSFWKSASTKAAKRFGFSNSAIDPGKTSSPCWYAIRSPSTNLARKTELSTSTGRK